MNIGRFYELHYKVDPDFAGAALGRGMRPWRGSALGLQKVQGWRRVWYSTPGPLKAAVGLGAGGAAGAAYWWFSDDEGSEDEGSDGDDQ
jgi:hypothetical protein